MREAPGLGPVAGRAGPRRLPPRAGRAALAPRLRAAAVGRPRAARGRRRRAPGHPRRARGPPAEAPAAAWRPARRGGRHRRAGPGGVAARAGRHRRLRRGPARPVGPAGARPHRRPGRGPAVPGRGAEGDAALGRRAARAGDGDLSAVGHGPRRRDGRARRPCRPRGRRRGPARGSRRLHRARPASAGGAARPRGSRAPAAAGLDAAPWRPRRDDPAADAGTADGKAALDSHRRPRLRSRRARGRSGPARTVGRAAKTAFATTGDRRRDRLGRLRTRNPRPHHELAARPRPRGLRRDRPARRAPQRVDTGVGRARARPLPGPALPGADLPPAARRAGLLGEPARARDPGRARHAPRRARARLQPHPAPERRGLGTRRAAARSAGQRRSPGRFRGGRLLRGGIPPLDPDGPPARRGDALPALRAPGPGPLLGSGARWAARSSWASSSRCRGSRPSTWARSPRSSWRWPSRWAPWRACAPGRPRACWPGSRWRAC